MSDRRFFPWAAQFDTAQLDAFLTDLWSAASGNTALATLHVVEAAIARHEPADYRGPECPLSERQMQAMTLIASGGTYASIARRLGITEHSARSHCAAAYDRIGAANAAHAVAICATQGWLPALPIPQQSAPVRRLSGLQWTRLLAERAATMQASPGVPVRIGPYATPTGARTAARNIKFGRLEPFLPAGSFTARAERIGHSRWEVEASYIGDPGDQTPSSALERPVSS
ncbi:LuxR C-terminal-related transcriptional regulator [Streptomyces sp. NPDC004528]|uniref:response regulator transcription factor n=1 Tax=Streptomyces sp. NPDC004528 TaxID=3154550 RepID=UPI0033AFA157